MKHNTDYEYLGMYGCVLHTFAIWAISFGVVQICELGDFVVRIPIGLTVLLWLYLFQRYWHSSSANDTAKKIQDRYRDDLEVAIGSEDPLTMSQYVGRSLDVLREYGYDGLYRIERINASGQGLSWIEGSPHPARLRSILADLDSLQAIWGKQPSNVALTCQNRIREQLKETASVFIWKWIRRQREKKH